MQYLDMYESNMTVVTRNIYTHQRNSPKLQSGKNPTNVHLNFLILVSANNQISSECRYISAKKIFIRKTGKIRF